MSDYVPPFTISNTMLELVSEISEKLAELTAIRNWKTNLTLEETTESDLFILR